MAASRLLLEDEGQPSSGSPLHIGQVIDGKYRIERQIGRGGMGIVLAATHLQLEHLVAIKVMRRDLVVDDRALDRLLMEARSAARIRSEHVARVLDVGTLENGSPFIVMEYLEGENLADLLDREGALEVDQAAAFLMQCCMALAEVHVGDMVHRDLKPGNLFIARLPDGSPTVKIVDFGISKQIGSAREGGATTSPQVLGSPFYMSPEQMRAEPVDERSDIWGLGAILFEMLTGRPPFIGDTLPEVYAAVLNEAPPNVDSLRSGVPAGLDDVVQRCLEKDPAQRFCDVADLAEALAPYAGTAAQFVERITRILTNSEAVRARYSLLPGTAPGAGVGASSAQVAVAAGRPSYAGIERRVEGIMTVGDDEDGAGSGGDRRSLPDGVAAPPGATLLESEAGLDREGVWRASRPPPSPEFSALSATGVRTGRSSGATKKRIVAWVAGVGGLTLLVIVGVRLGSRGRPPSAPSVAVESVKVAPPPGPSAPTAAVPIEPRVTPIVIDQPQSTTGARPGVPQSPAPPPRAKPPAPPPSGAPGTARAVTEPARSGSASAEEEDDDFNLPGTKPSEPPRPSAVTGDDPWNTEAFGDRR